MLTFSHVPNNHLLVIYTSFENCLFMGTTINFIDFSSLYILDEQLLNVLCSGFSNSCSYLLSHCGPVQKVLVYASVLKEESPALRSLMDSFSTG